MHKMDDVGPEESVLTALGHDESRVEAAMAALRGKETLSAAVEERLLTPQELCDRLGVSLTTLWRLQPPFLRVGSRKRFLWSEVQTHLRSKNGVAA